MPAPRVLIASALLLVALLGCGRGENPSAQAGNPGTAAYVASAEQEPFHRPTCEWAAKIKPENLQGFATRQEALRAGHRPCKVCRP